MGDAVWIKTLKTPHSRDVHVDNRRFMRKSSCRRSSLALSTVLPTAVRLWNRSAVSKQQSAAWKNLGADLHVLPNHPSLQPAWLRLQSCLLSGSAQRAVGQSGSSDSHVPSGTSDLTKGSSRICNRKNQQWRSQQIWFVPRGQTATV